MGANIPARPFPIENDWHRSAEAEHVDDHRGPFGRRRAADRMSAIGRLLNGNTPPARGFRWPRGKALLASAQQCLVREQCEGIGAAHAHCEICDASLTMKGWHERQIRTDRAVVLHALHGVHRQRFRSYACPRRPTTAAVVNSPSFPMQTLHLSPASAVQTSGATSFIHLDDVLRHRWRTDIPFTIAFLKRPALARRRPSSTLPGEPISLR